MFEPTKPDYKVHYHIKHKTTTFSRFCVAINDSIGSTYIDVIKQNISEHPYYNTKQNQHGCASVQYAMREIKREGWIYGLEFWWEVPSEKGYGHGEGTEVLIAEIIPIADEPRPTVKPPKKPTKKKSTAEPKTTILFVPK